MCVFGTLQAEVEYRRRVFVCEGALELLAPVVEKARPLVCSACVDFLRSVFVCSYRSMLTSGSTTVAPHRPPTTLAVDFLPSLSSSSFSFVACAPDVAAQPIFSRKEA